MNSEKKEALFEEVMELDDFARKRVLGTIFGLVELHEDQKRKLSPQEFFEKVEEKIALIKKEKQ